MPLQPSSPSDSARLDATVNVLGGLARSEGPQVVASVAPKKRGGRRPGAGRPAYLKPEQRKEKSVYVSLTSAEKERLEEAAKRSGLTLSFYIRALLGLPNSP